MSNSNSSFTTYELTDTEIREGSKLSHLQYKVIQNRIAEIAEDKLRLLFDPEHPLLFAQQEAELRGQLDILQYLLIESDNLGDD